MCAIYGYIARKDKAVSVETLTKIVRANIHRGPHSFGFAWIDDDGRLHCFKQKGRLTDHLGVLAMMRRARVLIGHLRFATHGDATDNINNHPHPADGGWVTHNGVIHNYQKLIEHRHLAPVSECDSEVLGLMIEQGDGSLLHRAADAVESTTGPLTMMGLWPRGQGPAPASLVVARRGNPLHVSEGPDGIYFGSLSGGLPKNVWQIKDDTIRVYVRKDGGIKSRVMDLVATEPATEPAGLFDDDGAYCGG